MVRQSVAGFDLPQRIHPNPKPINIEITQGFHWRKTVCRGGCSAIHLLNDPKCAKTRLRVPLTLMGATNFVKIRTENWPKIHAFYAHLLADYRLPVEPIIRLLEWIEEEGIERELFAFTSMHDLVITDQEEFDWDHHTLRVSLDFHTKKFHFEYARHSGASDRMTKEAEESGAIEVLRQFMAYKFGVHRSQKPNKSAAANALDLT